jgi:hypothetical protein
MSRSFQNRLYASESSLSLWERARVRVFVFPCLVLVLLFVPTPALAGHGFVSTFGNIEWLPEPGRTPDSVWYQLEAVQEEGQLLLAHDDAEKVPLCLTFAREKLAEVEAMIKIEDKAAAETAVERYREYITRAQQLISNADENKESLAETMATALLEHQYILSIIHEELPAEPRVIVPAVIEVAQQHYQDVIQFLSRKKKGALFFKEEEVRWSVQMMLRAEEEETENQKAGKSGK